MLFKLLENSGGVKQAIGDYTNDIFSVNPTGSDIYTIDNLVVCYTNRDKGGEVYGGITLENGIHMKWDNIVQTPMSIKKLSDWRMYGANVFVYGHHVQAILPLNIILNPLETFELVLNDDFTHLDTHTFFVTGFIN